MAGSQVWNTPVKLMKSFLYPYQDFWMDRTKAYCLDRIIFNTNMSEELWKILFGQSQKFSI